MITLSAVANEAVLRQRLRILTGVVLALVVVGVAVALFAAARARSAANERSGKLAPASARAAALLSDAATRRPGSAAT